MGCNAWNHPEHCACGWGGVFYGAGYRDGADDSWHWQRSDSYTTPNARCPRCLARVFFYRSPYGGSVYFDDLGPPWPKHPCMDTGRTAAATSPSRIPAVTASSRPVTMPRREPGWRPMICDEVRRHPRCDQVVVLKVQGGPGAGSTLYAEFDRRLLDHRTPFLARRRKDGSVEISTLNTQLPVPGEIRFVAYPSLNGLPQPFLDQALGLPAVKVVYAAHAAASAPPPPEAIAPAQKPPRPDPTKVQITYKHRRHDEVRSKAKTKAQSHVLLAPVAPALAAAAGAFTPKRLAVPLPAKRSWQDRAPSNASPLTTMALAFQKLAASDPEVEEMFITGFRQKSGLESDR
jgi:hypothetical protein